MAPPSSPKGSEGEDSADSDDQAASNRSGDESEQML